MLDRSDIEILNKTVHASVNQKITKLYTNFLLAIDVDTNIEELKKRFSKYINQKYVKKHDLIVNLIHELGESVNDAIILEKFKVDTEEDIQYFGFF